VICGFDEKNGYIYNSTNKCKKYNEDLSFKDFYLQILLKTTSKHRCWNTNRIT